MVQRQLIEDDYRPERALIASGWLPPPPVPNPRPAATPPVGVREGDVLIIGTDPGMNHEQLHSVWSELRLVLGDVRIVFVPSESGLVTVLRPER